MSDLFARVVRVSTELQAKTGYSLDVQEEFLYDLIKRSGGETRPDLLLKDDGYSGDDWNRPAIRQGLEWIRAGKVNGLAFLDTDRFARDVHGALGYLKDVCKAGGRVLFGDMGEYRGNDAEFLLTFNIKLSLGQYQKAKTKALSRMATMRKVRDGEPHTQPPYGYRKEGKTKTSPERVVVVPEHARIVVLIYIWYTKEGLSLAAIARRLIAEGVPPPKSHWNIMTLKKILSRDTYYNGIWGYSRTETVEPNQIRSAGPRHRRRTTRKPRPESEWIPIEIEPIISSDLFQQAAVRLAENIHTLGGRPSATYRLKGVIRCPLCNSYYVGIRNHGYPRYVCSNCRDRVTRKRKCMAPGLPARATETGVLEAIRDLLTNERKLEAYVLKHRAELAAGASTPDIEKIRKRIEEIGRREGKARAEVLKAAESGDAEGEAFFDRELREARAQRLELQGQLRAKAIVVDFGKVDVKAIAAAVRKGLALATPEQQQKLIQGLVGESRR